MNTDEKPAALPHGLDLDINDWGALLGGLGQPAFRAMQVFEALHAQGLRDFEALSTWPKALRHTVAGAVRLTPLNVQQTHAAPDDTTRWVLTGDGPQFFEMVHIPLEGRNTLCLSSQCGCAVGCAFCATGTLGFLRHLQPWEMVEQVTLAEAQTGPLKHLVLMGMGEPMLNLDNVLRFLHLITHPRGRAFGPRHITLSTVGMRGGFDRLLTFELPVGLALSLHAATEDLRQTLVPRAGSSIIELLDFGAAYAQKINQPTTLEWTLLSDLNDTPEQAHELARLVQGKPFKVNLIPVNPVAGLPLTQSPPGEKQVGDFMAVLRQAGVDVFRRDTRGQAVNAACGQLAARAGAL